MKIAVIGTINYDRVVLENGHHLEGFGGILYNIIAFARLSEGIEIFPVTWIGEKRKGQLWGILANYPQVKTEGIRVNPSGTNENLLIYSSFECRDETLKSRVPPVDFKQIEPFLDCDLILVNFISGFDLSLATLKRLRRSFQASIFIDIHSLTLGLGPQGRRYPKGVADWEKWIECGDMVQANRKEAEILTGQELTDEGHYEEVASAMLDLGPSVILLTLGKRGCLVAYKMETQKLFSLVPAPRVEVKDTTGAGDVFSAAFIIKYVDTENALESAQFATSMAATACETMGLQV